MCIAGPAAGGPNHRCRFTSTTARLVERVERADRASALTVHFIPIAIRTPELEAFEAALVKQYGLVLGQGPTVAFSCLYETGASLTAGGIGAGGVLKGGTMFGRPAIKFLFCVEVDGRFLGDGRPVPQ